MTTKRQSGKSKSRPKKDAIKDWASMLTTVDSASLRFDPHNARRHGAENKAAVIESIRRFGIRQPLVVRRADNVVIAGNLRLECLRELGVEKVPVIFVDDDSEAESIAYALADNRTAELAEWNGDLLAEQIGAMMDLDASMLVGWSNEDALALIGASVEVAEDEVPEPPVDPVTKAGDLIVMGKHRLLCGDSTKAEDVARVMGGEKINVAFTSPPYALQRKYDESSGFTPIPPDDYVEWWEPIQKHVAAHLASEGSFFVNIKPAPEGLDTHLYVFDLILAHVRRWGWNFATEFCWERNGVPKRVKRRFKNQFEPIYQFTRGDWKIRPKNVAYESDFAIKNGGGGRVANAQGIKNAVPEGGEGMAYPGNRLPSFCGSHEALGHSAAFPVGLPSWFIRAYSDDGDVVFDPFLGSGSTIIAAEQLGRRCFGIEISLKYCDVIVQRWEALTGLKAIRS